MNFAEISKNLRKEKKLSQAELAEHLQVSKACISMIEIGRNEPTAITLTKYADFFGCSIDYLLGREDDFGNVTVVSGVAPLPREEQSLLANFRKLPDDLRYRAGKYLERLVELYEEERAPKMRKNTGQFPA